MQPPQYDLQCPAVAFTHAAAAPSNLDAAITIRSAKTESDWVAKHQKKNTAAPIREWSRHSRHLPRHVLFCKTRLFVHLLTLKTHFVRDFPQKVKVEDVKMKLSCETSLQKRKWKMWKWSFCARHPSKSESGRCENEAFVRDIPPKAKVEDVKTKLSCETSLQKRKWKMWKRSFRARHPSTSES